MGMRGRDEDNRRRLLVKEERQGIEAERCVRRHIGGGRSRDVMMMRGSRAAGEEGEERVWGTAL